MSGSGLLFIFDMDDVLYEYRWHERMQRLSAITGVGFDELRRRWWIPYEHQAEAGVPDNGAEYLAAFTAAIGVPVSEEEWIAARSAAMTARPGALAAVRRASELGTVTLLTNNGALVHEHLGAGIAPELAALFEPEHLNASSAYGARKPDPEVFRRVLDRLGTDASSAFFTDDLPENVAGARSIGITAHLYRDEAGLLEAIEDFARRSG